MAQLLPRIFALSTHCRESCQQASQRAYYRLKPDVIAIANEAAGFADRGFTDTAPGEAYGTHWLTR
jgi:hypothetical protein